jgi:8-oxo-dGTP diphosphatase
VIPTRLQRVAAYAVTVDAGRLLLVRLSERTPYPGSWTLPGGGIDFGEDPRDAVLRELHEETGLVGTVEALLGIHSGLREPDRGLPDRLHALRIVYRVSVDASGPLTIHDVGGTTDAVEWVDLATVADRWLSPAVEFALTRLAHPGAPA